MPMTGESEELFDARDEREIALEPLPPFADERHYLHCVVPLPVPTNEQIADFVSFVSCAKSWYKHLPAHPPGAPLYFYLDPNAGRERLRRWGHQAIYRDREEHTKRIHYSWMTTVDYRKRFGYLAFCCRSGTGIWMDEMLADGIAVLDPNVSEPLIEGEPGKLLLVPEGVLETGACLVTRTLHTQTDAASLWKKWNKTVGDHRSPEPLSGRWPRIARLCEELGGERSARQVKVREGELDALIKKQRADDHGEISTAIQRVIDFVHRSARGAH